MPVQDATDLKSSVKVKVDGADLDPAQMELCELVRIKDEWMLPSAATLRFFEPQGQQFEWSKLDIGRAVTIELGKTEARTTTPTFDGEIVAVEPDFLPDGTTWTFRALDRGHRLMRGTKTRTFLQQTAADVAQTLARESGLRPGGIEATGTVHPYLVQAGESDWTYLWRHALALGFTVRVTGRSLHFRKAAPDSADGPTLRYRENLRAFRPRRSAVSQVDDVQVLAWDSTGKRTIIGAASRSSADVPGTGTTGQDLFGSASHTATEAMDGQASADRRAQALLDRLAAGQTEAEGIAQGDPALRAGSTVRIEGLGRGWDARYQLTTVEHVYRPSGYETHVTIGGRAPRTLLDIVGRPSRRQDVGSQLLIGIVTNAKDPEKLGRVKVKLPTLGTTRDGVDVESFWARIATLGAGPQRGVVMMPQVDDEVVVAFESGDLRRPVVLGSLFNGKDKPHPDHLKTAADRPVEPRQSPTPGPDSSFVVRSDHLMVVETRRDQTFKAVQGAIVASSKGDNTTRTDANVSTEAKGNVTTQAQGNVEIKAKGNLTEEATGNAKVSAAGATTISGSTSVTVESAGSMTIRANGVLTIQASQVNITGSLINLG